MIKKEKGKYVVLSDTTVRHGSRQAGRVFGRYRTKKEAQKRLKQMEMFKHLNLKKR